MKPLQPIMDMLERADNPRMKAVMVCKESQDGAKEEQEDNWSFSLFPMTGQR